ncbi:flavin-containing monooxygenase, partial [Acinetobacter baumannii]
DIAADYICRLLNYMDKNNYDEVIPSGDKSVMEEDTVMGSLSSGYISRAADVIPKQGKQAPWQVTNNYLEDRKSLKNAKFDDGVLRFHKHSEVTTRKPKLVS